MTSYAWRVYLPTLICKQAFPTCGERACIDLWVCACMREGGREGGREGPGCVCSDGVSDGCASCPECVLAHIDLQTSISHV